MNAALLIPVRIRAIGTLTDNRWGTRLVRKIRRADVPDEALPDGGPA